jgi:oxygen-dependent protoporphyrinogen oxidase
MKVAIVGGGISGLSTAFYIKHFEPDAEVYLFEKRSHLGGTMHTENVNGFLFETGSNGFLSNKPHALGLVRDSGGEALLMRSHDAARIRYVFTDRLHRLPESPLAFIRTGLLSWRGKCRTLGEVWVPPRKEGGDETLKDFGYRRLGKEFTDVFLNAMSAGIYASTPETISVNAAFPAVVTLERDYGGLFKGMFKKRKKRAGPTGMLMSFTGGVGTFIDHLHKTLDAKICTRCEVTGLEPTKNGHRVSTEQADFEVNSVILCTPADVSATLLKRLDAQLAARLSAIEYSPISVVGLGYDRLDHPLNGFGLLTTASAKKEILGVLWDSAIFPDRAPEGKKSLRVMIGGQRNPGLALKDDSTLLGLALTGVRETMGIDQSPAVTFVKRWERGIPHYRVGHLANVDSIFRILQKYPGIFLNSNAYYGIGLNECVHNSRECAKRATGFEGH